MSVACRTIYILRHNSGSADRLSGHLEYKDVGEAETIAGLQRIYDILLDSLVESIRRRRPLAKDIPNITIVKKCLDMFGFYVTDTTGPTPLSTLENVHGDFFKYLTAYTRDLYKDRMADRAAATILLDAIEKKGDLRREIDSFERTWFEEQRAAAAKKGVGLVMPRYPVCPTSAELSTLIANTGDALQILERKTLLLVEHSVVPGTNIVP